jgi:predicted ATPase
MDPDGFGLATLLDDILGYDPERFLALRRDFCEFFPQFSSVRIETQQALNRQFNITGKHASSMAIGKGIVFVTTQGRAIRAQHASDGAILFLGLLALIHSPEPPNLLLIEEPEKGVYPKRLEEVICLIRRLHAAGSGRAAPQIVMTTHSPYLLTSFHPDEVTFMVRRNGSGSVLARPLRDAPHIEERLGAGEFYLGELWYNLSEEELFADA